jgi:hypothetical protein
MSAVWQRCWCYRTGRCLVDCPTADLPQPVPLTDDNWRRGYAEALRLNVGGVQGGR